MQELLYGMLYMHAYIHIYMLLVYHKLAATYISK